MTEKVRISLSLSRCSFLFLVDSYILISKENNLIRRWSEIFWINENFDQHHSEEEKKKERKRKKKKEKEEKARARREQRRRRHHNPTDQSHISQQMQGESISSSFFCFLFLFFLPLISFSSQSTRRKTRQYIFLVFLHI